MKKLLFLSTRLGGGGAERVLSYILSDVATDKDYNITLILLHSHGNTYLSQVPGNINIVNLNLKGRIRYSIFKIIRTIISHRPDICYVGLDKLNIMLAFFIPILNCFGIKTITRETNVLSRQYNPDNPFVSFAYRFFYNKYTLIITQSNDMRDDLIKKWGITTSKTILINNPIDIDKVAHLSQLNPSIKLPGNCFNFVAVGRLSWQKGYDILIQRIKEIAGTRLPIHITILGTGELEEELTNAINNSNITEYITLAGFQENPYSIMAQADGIILSSRYEGFPNVLLEANSLGKPILSNLCPGGINEIIIEGVNGLACDFENPTEFQTTLQRFLSSDFDKEEIKRLTANRYSLSEIMPKYRDVFRRLL